MPRYDVFLEGRTENSTCYFGVAVMADDQKEAEFLGHEAGRVKHQECDEIEVVGVMPVISARNAGKRRLCWSIPLKERALKFVKEAMKREWSHSGPMPEVWRENYLFGILPERTGLHNPKRRKSSETLCIQKRRTKRERSGL